MPAFDYGVEGALVFTSEGIRAKPISSVPFQLASDAIRFAVEELKADSFEFVYLETNGKHYDEIRIRELYDAVSYPLTRSMSETRLPWPSIVDDYPSRGL